MVSNQYSVRVLEQSLVSPPPGSAIHSVSLPLTFFDITWLYVPPVELLFLYHFPHPTPHFLTSHLPNLKSSLSLTLQHFYPLAGKVRLSPDSTKQFELHYEEGDSVSFTAAESDLDFIDLVGSHPRESAKFQTLVPQLPKSDNDDENSPLLAIQVTLFPNCGVGICFTMHHVACDGVNAMHFIKSWASSYKSSGQVPLVEPYPSFDRSVIVDPCNLYSEYLNDILALKINNPKPPLDATTAPSDLVTASFTLGPDRIEALKDLVRSKALERKAASFDCSTFAVCCAYAWVCLVKTQGRRDDGNAYFGFVVDWRKQIQPANPGAYFGNCLGFRFAEAKVSELTKEDGVFAAFAAIASAVEGLKDGVLKNMVGAVRKYLALLPYHPLTVAGSLKFTVYDTDFGWGRPQKFEVTSIKNTGAMSLAESREGAGGGVEIGFVLPKQEMEALTVQFENGVKFGSGLDSAYSKLKPCKVIITSSKY